MQDIKEIIADRVLDIAYKKYKASCSRSFDTLENDIRSMLISKSYNTDNILNGVDTEIENFKLHIWNLVREKFIFTCIDNLSTNIAYEIQKEKKDADIPV